MFEKLKRNFKCKISSEISGSSKSNSNENKFHNSDSHIGGKSKSKTNKRHCTAEEGFSFNNVKKKNVSISSINNNDHDIFSNSIDITSSKKPLPDKQGSIIKKLLPRRFIKINNTCQLISIKNTNSNLPNHSTDIKNEFDSNLCISSSTSDKIKSKDHNTYFYINKSGFPMDEETWEQMWSFACHLHPLGGRLEELIRNQDCPEVPIPKPPLNLPPHMSVVNKIELVQKYLDNLQYNYTGTQFFDIKKNKPICYLMDYAKEMIKASLPIKCLEAVVLAIYCTSQYPNLDRFPVSFKSQHRGRVHRHVILGVHHLGKYGALGLSRKVNLMYKPISYLSLSDLLLDFVASYRNYGHKLFKIKIGNSVSHNIMTCESIQWNLISLNCDRADPNKLKNQIEKSSRIMKKRSADWHFNGTFLRSNYDMQTRSNSLDLIQLTKTNSSMPTLLLDAGILNNKADTSSLNIINNNNNNNNKFNTTVYKQPQRPQYKH